MPNKLRKFCRYKTENFSGGRSDRAVQVSVRSRDSVPPVQQPCQIAVHPAWPVRRVGQLLHADLQSAGHGRPAGARRDRPRVDGGMVGHAEPLAALWRLRGHPRRAAHIPSGLGQKADIRDRLLEARGARRHVEVHAGAGRCRHAEEEQMHGTAAAGE